MSRSSDGTPRLRVSSRAAGEYLGLQPPSMAHVIAAGILEPLPDGGYDARSVQELGARPFIDQNTADAFEPHTVLLLQQSSPQELDADSDDRDWGRSRYGWGTSMSDDEVLMSMSGWWPVSLERIPGLIGIVSSVGGFVVATALIDRSNPVAGRSGNKVRFHVSPVTDETRAGRMLKCHFEARRLPQRQGSSRAFPDA